MNVSRSVLLSILVVAAIAATAPPATSGWLSGASTADGVKGARSTTKKFIDKATEVFRQASDGVSKNNDTEAQSSIDDFLAEAGSFHIRKNFRVVRIADKAIETARFVKEGVAQQLQAVKDKIASYGSRDDGTAALAVDLDTRDYFRRKGIIGGAPLRKAALSPPPSASAGRGSPSGWGAAPRTGSARGSTDPWAARTSTSKTDPWADPPVTDPDAATVDAWAQACFGRREKPSTYSADFYLFKRMREDHISKHGTADCAAAGQRRPASGAGGEPRDSYHKELARTLGDDPRAADGSYTDALDAMEQAERERREKAEQERRERELAVAREQRERELAAARERRERKLAAARERRERELAAARERHERAERERRQRNLAATRDREEEAERRREDALLDAQVRELRKRGARNRAQAARDLAEGVVNMLNVIANPAGPGPSSSETRSGSGGYNAACYEECTRRGRERGVIPDCSRCRATR